jgi:CheY-like chemotaxis protein
MRILLADDNADVRETTRALIEMQGHEVQEAADGAEALAKAQSWKPEVILLDVGMPNLNGYEVARHVRLEPWGKHALLVAITGYGEAEDLKKSCTAGFDAHRVKPADVNELLALFDDWQTRRGHSVPGDAC